MRLIDADKLIEELTKITDNPHHYRLARDQAPIVLLPDLLKAITKSTKELALPKVI